MLINKWRPSNRTKSHPTLHNGKWLHFVRHLGAIKESWNYNPFGNARACSMSMRVNYMFHHFSLYILWWELWLTKHQYARPVSLPYAEATRPVGPSSKMGNVQMGRKVDEIFLDDPDLKSIDPGPAIVPVNSLASDASDASLPTDEHLPSMVHLRDLVAFNSWTDTTPGEAAPLPPNRLTHQLWTAQIDAFRALVEAHQSSFQRFVERKRSLGRQNRALWRSWTPQLMCNCH